MIIDITIPVLNEEETLERQVKKADSYIRNNLSDLGAIRLVIADNGSTDQTAEVAKKLATEAENIALISLPRAGVGLALKASWSQSKADIVGYMDLDLATDLDCLRPALEPLISGDVDVVSGSRLKRGSKVIGRSLKRAVISRAFNYLIRIYLGAKFSDGMCGFKFLQRNHLPAIIQDGAVSEGWFFSTELLACAQHLGLRLFDLPITWKDDPSSKVKIGKLTVEYISAMRRLRAKHRTAAVA